ncbi:MAG: rhomboid family intramembrane serine protease [Planctomycetes bacterium]|nr:rhomboid family intramembrane serine protease [Planctomycetota bacterium]
MSGPLAETARTVFGHSPLQMANGSWGRILSSLFITGDPIHFFQAFAMILFCVGTLECQSGSRIAAASFLSVHLVTLLIQSGILLSVHAWVDQGWTHQWSSALDVGPSAGYYGCLGVAIFRWNSARRGWIIIAVLSILLLRWMAAATFHQNGTQFQSDMAHAIAFPLGLALGHITNTPKVKSDHHRQINEV